MLADRFAVREITMKEKIFRLAKIVLVVLVVFHLLWWLMLYSTGHRIPTNTNYQFIRDIILLGVLLILTFIIEKRLKKN